MSEDVDPEAMIKANISNLDSWPTAAVHTASGFNAKKDLLTQLLALNYAVAPSIEHGSPVTAPACPRIIPPRRYW